MLRKFEVAASQGVGQRQHLEPAGHSLNLGIQHQADAACVFEHALCGVVAVLLVIVENDAGRENDHRQRRSRDQKSEPDWQ